MDTTFNPKLIALLPDLASFILVVNEGSFTAAAKQLGVTPSALSKLITRLEKALSVAFWANYSYAYYHSGRSTGLRSERCHD